MSYYYKEEFWVNEDVKVRVVYSVDPPEPDVGYPGGVAIRSLDFLSGDPVSPEDVEEEVLEILKADLEE
jgi:hypothetical protein